MIMGLFVMVILRAHPSNKTAYKSSDKKISRLVVSEYLRAYSCLFYMYDTYVNEIYIANLAWSLLLLFLRIMCGPGWVKFAKPFGLL